MQLTEFSQSFSLLDRQQQRQTYFRKKTLVK